MPNNNNNINWAAAASPTQRRLQQHDDSQKQVHNHTSIHPLPQEPSQYDKKYLQ